MTPQTLHTREEIITLLDQFLSNLEKEQRQKKTFTTTDTLHHKLECKIRMLFWQYRYDIPFNITRR